MVDSTSVARSWRRLVRVAAASVLSLGAVLAVAIVWLANNETFVRRAIEHAVTSASGHPFTVAGELTYTLGTTVEVHASRIGWRKAGSETSPKLIAIAELDAALDLWSLLDWPIRVMRLEASGTTLRLDWDEAHGFNWDFRSPGTPDPRRPQPPAPFPLVIEKASLENLDVRLRHPALTDELQVRVTEAHQLLDASHRLVISGEAVLDGRRLALAARIGPFPQLAVAGAIDFDLSVDGPLASFTGVGNVASLADLRNLKLALRLQADNAGELSQRLRLPLKTTGTVDLAADLAREGDGITVTGGGAYGEFAFQTHLHSQDLSSFHDLEAYLQSTGPSARGLATLADLPGMPDAPYRLEARARRTAEGLAVEKLRFETAGLAIEGSGLARDVAKLRDIDFNLTAQGVDFGVIAALIGRKATIPLPFRLRASIVAHEPGTHDELDIALALGDAKTTLAGSLSEAADLSDSRLRFTVDAPKADQVLNLLGLSAPAGTTLTAQGETAITGDKIDLEALSISLGDARLSGSAQIERHWDVPAFSFKAQAEGPDFAAFVRPVVPQRVATTLPRQAFSAKVEARASQGRLRVTAARAVIGANSLNFQGLIDAQVAPPALTGDLSATGDDLGELFSHFSPGDLPIKQFNLESRLHLSSESARLEALTLTAPHLRVQGRLALAGRVFERIEFELAGSGDDFTTLVPTNAWYAPPAEPFHVAMRGTADPATVNVERLVAEWGNARAALSGELQLQPTLGIRRLRLDASGSRLSSLGRLANWRLTERPFHVAASVQGDAREALVDELRFESAGNTLTGRVRYTSHQRPRFEIQLASSQLNLDEIRTPVSRSRGPETVAIANDRLFSSEPLPFELLHRFDAEISLRVDELVANERRWRNLAVEAIVEDSALQIRRAEVDAARGKVRLEGSIASTAEGGRLALDIRASEAMLASVTMTPEDVDRLPRHAIDARLSASGNTAHELAASLDGFVWAIGGEGEASRAKIAPLYGGFLSELLSAVDPFEAKRASARIDCDGFYLEIDGGKVTTAPAIVLQTEHVIVIAYGSVDLATERIDFIFETTPLRGIGLSVGDLVNPFTKLSGTLRDPQIVLHPGRALVEGGAAVATGGLTVLVKGLWKRWFGSHRVCEKVGDKAVELRGKRDPDNVPDLEAMLAGTGIRSETKTPDSERPETKPASVLDEIDL
jgi:uncharacterized protein involved in outer membrane biogenesis